LFFTSAPPESRKSPPPPPKTLPANPKKALSKQFLFFGVLRKGSESSFQMLCGQAARSHRLRWPCALRPPSPHAPYS
jgi:hypothetical protein